MPDLLQHVLDNLYKKDSGAQTDLKQYTPHISTSTIAILDKSAPKSLLKQLTSHNAPHTTLSLDEHLKLSNVQEKLNELATRKEPNGLIITQSVAENNRLALKSLLSHSHINTPVIIYAKHPEINKAIQYMRTGILDYWSESSEFNMIKSSLENLLLTDRKRKLKRTLILDIQQRIHTLTNREKQVIGLLLSTKEEMTNKKIAGYLKLSPRTIEDYRANAMEKLAITTKHELILMWLVAHHLEITI